MRPLVTDLSLLLVCEHGEVSGFVSTADGGRSVLTEGGIKQGREFRTWGDVLHSVPRYLLSVALSEPLHHKIK